VTLRFAVQDAWQLEQFWQSIIHSARRADCAPEKLSGAEIERWLVYDASKQLELLLAYEEFAWRMVAAGLPIDQSGLYIGTLHPLLRGFAWTWRRSDASCDELKVKEGVIGTESARRSPLWKLFSTRQPLRCCPQDLQVQSEFPIMAEYAAMGFTDYVARLLGEGSPRLCLRDAASAGLYRRRDCAS
jgi:adenylate cyclase